MVIGKNTRKKSGKMTPVEEKASSSKRDSIEIPVAKMTLLPPAPDVCQECAVKHNPSQPHNAQSLYYQTKFQMEHGRSATWADAMAHCDDMTKAIWTRELEARGVDVNGKTRA